MANQIIITKKSSFNSGVKVSNTDQDSDYLENKLVSGAGISFTKQSIGLNETYSAAVDPILYNNLHVQGTDSGTTLSSFKIDSDSPTAIQLKNDSGTLNLRNSDDTEFANLIVKDLTVNGTQTIIHSSVLEIDDNTITINAGTSGTPTLNAGIIVDRGTETNAQLLWDENLDKWKAGLAGNEFELQSLITSGNLSVVSPLIQTGGENAIIGSGVNLSIQDATISQKGAVQLSNSSSGTLETVAVTEKALTDGDKLKTAGPTSIPTFTDNGDGTATIGSCTANIYPSTDFSGILREYSLSSQTLTFIDGNEEYVVADYNSGSPIIRKETNKYLINGGSIFTLFIVWRQGTTLHSIDNDSYGLGLASKTYRMLYNTESYKRSVDGGLILSELPSRNIKVTSSVVYAGSTPVSVTEYNSSSGDLLTQAFTSGSTWFYNNVSSYDNTHYDTGSGILLLDDNRWSNRFFYRSIGDVKETFYTLGQEQFFNHDRCFDELPPTPPILLRDHCIYVGRTIVEKNATSGTVHPIFDHIEPEPEYSFYGSSGIWDSPTITTGTNTITVGTGSYILYDDTNYESHSLDKYKITGQTFTIANDQATHYIIAKYNTGNPIITQTSDVNEINQSDVIPILTCFNLEGQILYLFWDNFAKGLANKLCHRFVKTDRFKVQPGGLILSEKATRYITITSGVVWYGATYSELSSIDSSVSGNEIALWYHVGGTLTRFTTTTYDNTFYDDGTDRVELNPNRYAVNWVYRGVSQLNNRPVILLGEGNYVLADAIASNPPSDLPAVTTNFGKLVGRIIVKKGDSVATQIDSLQADTGISPVVSNHNGLSGLQGGTFDEYYHLTALEHTTATQAASGSQSGILSSTDWNTFNNKLDSLTSGNLTESTSDILTILGGTGAVIGTGVSIQVKQASLEQDGYLASSDFLTFNSKQNQLSSGNLIASSPLQIDDGINAIIGVNRTLSVQDASISQKGVTQLSNSYIGTSQILAATEKALSDGLGTKQNILTNPIKGTGTSGQLAQFIDSTSVIGISASLSDNNAIHDNVAGEINALTEETSPDSTDIVLLEDSGDSYAKKKATLENILNTRLGIERRITIANNSSDASYDIDFAAGWMYDSTGVYKMLLSSTLVKRIDTAGNWTAGTDQRGLATGLIVANNTWYYCFVIYNPTTGATDAGFDTSLTASNLLAGASGYTVYRRVGAIYTDGSANIRGFIQTDKIFWWKDQITDAAGQAISTTHTNYRVSVPAGVRCLYYGYFLTSAVGTPDIYIYSPDSNTPAVSPYIDSNLTQAVLPTLTNTSGQLRLGSSANTSINYLLAAGYCDLEL